MENAETKLYQVTKGCAQWKNIPIYFIARVLAETPKAYYLYGHGTAEVAKMGVCMVCGRELTHPVSVELGIGPECGKHYWDWNAVGGYTIENVKRLTQLIQKDMRIDSWIPKGLVVTTDFTNEVVGLPADHPMLKRKEVIVNPVRTASLIQDPRGNMLVKIVFPYNQDDIIKVKGLNNRRFHADDKCWSVPLSADSVQKLKDWGFSLDLRLDQYINKAKVSVDQIEAVDVPGLKGTLFPFQNIGISFVEAKGGRALIADDMGLGKTVQALGWLQLHPEKRPVIIVVPASLKLNWKKEAEMWMPAPKVEILSGTSPYKTTGEILIINYDVLTDWVDYLLSISPKVLILDEAHYTKNKAAQRTKAVLTLGKSIPHVIALSGTPIVNRPVEFFNILKLVDSTVVPSFWEYVHKYCAARNNGFGWDFSGSSNTEELHRLLTSTIMIRRKKMDVLTDLPEKIRSWTPIELDNEQDYYKAERDFISFVRDKKGDDAASRASNAEALAEIEGLKQLAVQGKLSESISWIRDSLDANGKLVVFAVHKFVVDALMNAFPNIAVKIDGGVSSEDRQLAVDRFQNDPKIRLFIGNIKAAGVGLTLTASSNVVFLELPWTPGDLTQAEDRCHRIGQKDCVNIHYLLAANTIEEKIAKLIDKKRKVLDAVLDGTITEEESLLSELLKEYN